MWWHLKLGEIVWKTHRIPLADTFSFTAYGYPTVPHEWLAQTLIFAFYRCAGYSGIMLWLCLASSALIVGGYALCALYSGNARIAFAGAILVWLFSTVGLSVRPQLLGYLCMLIELIVLHLGRTRSPRWFFALPPLFALWINCHGSFYFGIFITVLQLLCSYFAFEKGGIAACPWEPRARRFLAVALALSLPALLLNPVGWRMVAYPARILFASPVNLGQVAEWQPLRLNDPRGIAFLVVCAAILLAAAMRIAVLYLHELALLSVSALEAAQHERLLIVFGLIAAPILCRMFASSWENYAPEQNRPAPNAVLIAASCLVCWIAFPSHANLAAQVKASSPEAAVAFIHTNHLSGPMLNQYVFGGYLIWAAPDHPVFVDGRTDIFEWTGVFAEYGQWATLEADPRTLLDKYGIQFCLLDRSSPMTHVLALLPEWKLDYQDDVAAVFVRTAAQGSVAAVNTGR